MLATAPTTPGALTPPGTPTHLPAGAGGVVDRHGHTDALWNVVDGDGCSDRAAHLQAQLWWQGAVEVQQIGGWVAKCCGWRWLQRPSRPPADDAWGGVEEWSGWGAARGAQPDALPCGTAQWPGLPTRSPLLSTKACFCSGPPAGPQTLATHLGGLQCRPFLDPHSLPAQSPLTQSPFLPPCQLTLDDSSAPTKVASPSGRLCNAMASPVTTPAAQQNPGGRVRQAAKPGETGSVLHRPSGGLCSATAP